MNKESILNLGQKDVRQTMPNDILNLNYDLVLVHTPIPQMFPGIPFAFQYTTCTLVESGTARFVIDMQEYQLTRGSLLVVLDNRISLLESYSEDFSAQTLFMSESFLQSLQIGSTLELRQMMRHRPLSKLSEESFQAIRQYYLMLAAALSHSENPFREKMIFHLTKAYFYGLGYYLHPIQTLTSPDRNTQVTQTFFELLHEHFKKDRAVLFYADKLHLTPKYLSACIKECTGHSAMECIEQQTILYAENLLANTPLTISQISDDLHFDSPSTFGKYFRTHVGISPKEWKNRLR